MEENLNHNKTSRLIILLVIALTIIIALLGYLMNQQKVASDKEIAELKSREATLQSTITELQGKLDSINDIASNNESTEEIETQEISGSGFTAKLENDTIIITLKNQDGTWTDSDFNAPINNKSYTVSGLKNGIKKIVSTNRSSDVNPEIMILMNDGDVYNVELAGPVINVMFGTKNPDDIKFTVNKVEELKNIENIFGYEEGQYAIDKSGTKITLYDGSR